MPLSLNGSGGITYPDGSVNTTRSASVAGDTFTGPLNVNTAGFGVKTAGANFSGVSMRATGTGGREYVITSTDNANGLGGGLLNIFDQTAGVSRVSVDANGIIRTNASPQSGKFSIYSDGAAPLVYQMASNSWTMRGKYISTYTSGAVTNLLTINNAGGNMNVAVKVTARVVSAVADQFCESEGWAFVRYFAASGYANNGITQQMTNTMTYNMSVPGSLSWSQSGSNWTLRYTNTFTGYISHTIDVDVVCRDGANITLDAAYVGHG